MLPAVLLLLGLATHFLDSFDLRLPHRGRLNIMDDYDGGEYSGDELDGLCDLAHALEVRSEGSQDSDLGPGGVDADTWLYGREGYTTGICDQNGVAVDHPGAGRSRTDSDEDRDPDARIHNTIEWVHPFRWEHLGSITAARRSDSRDQADDFVLQELNLCYHRNVDGRTEAPWPLCLRDFLDDLITLWYTPLEIALFFRSLLFAGWSTLDVVQRDWWSARRSLDLHSHRESKWEWLPEDECTIRDQQHIRLVCKRYRATLGPPRALAFSHGCTDDHIPPCLRPPDREPKLHTRLGQYFSASSASFWRRTYLVWKRKRFCRVKAPQMRVTWEDPISEMIVGPRMLDPAIPPGRVNWAYPLESDATPHGPPRPPPRKIFTGKSFGYILPPSASAAPTPASPAAPGAPADAATSRALTFDTFDDSISTAGGRADKAASSAIKSSSEYTKHSMVLLSSTGEGDLDVGAGGRTALVDSSSTATLDELCSALQASSLYSIGTNSIRESYDPSWPTATAIISAATISSSLAHPTFVAPQPVCRFSLRRGSLVAGSGQPVGPPRERIAVTIQRGHSVALPDGGDAGAGGGAGAAAGARGF